MAAKTKSEITKTAATSKTLADFRAAHDKSFVIPNKIKAAIEKLGKEGWNYEAEFVALTGVSQTDFARYRDQFEQYFVVLNERTGKRVWAGSAALANKLREML